MGGVGVGGGGGVAAVRSSFLGHDGTWPRFAAVMGCPRCQRSWWLTTPVTDGGARSLDQAWRRTAQRRSGSDFLLNTFKSGTLVLPSA